MKFQSIVKLYFIVKVDFLWITVAVNKISLNKIYNTISTIRNFRLASDNDYRFLKNTSLYKAFIIFDYRKLQIELSPNLMNRHKI
jgi:hypothetical protein